tara:strand:- start:136 stop:345 length:210 start_codon:yes stop_codon:yes gene_type:complete
MKITKRQLRRIISEIAATVPPPSAGDDELFDARDNLLGLIETLNPDEAIAYIDTVIEELARMKRDIGRM